jgi:hypothetical protein
VIKEIELSQREHVKIPRLPNFLIVDEGRSVDVCSYSKDELERIADAWKANLIEHAIKRKSTAIGALP